MRLALVSLLFLLPLVHARSLTSLYDAISDDLHEHPLSKRNSVRWKRQAYPVYTSGDRKLTVDQEGIKESGPWGTWQVEKECSRTCGGGVLEEKRQCGGDCVGPSTRYVSCSTEKCEGGDLDFRGEQCAEYNDQELEGKYYKWNPVIGKDKCELNCQPEGENFYYRWADKVTDGTKCDLMKNDICVDGLCLPLGCDGRLGSAIKEDKCLVCGGDGSECKTIEGFFDERGLDAGYHDVIVLPEGATSIKIYEMRATANSLAIRNASGHYLLNGGFQIQVLPGNLEIAGTLFGYEKRKKNGQTFEALRAKGPLDQELTIALIYQMDSKYSAIQYEFSVPLDESQKYIYKPGPWTGCSVTCGKGVHTRVAECLDAQQQIRVPEGMCEEHNASKPELNKTCETIDCDAEWFEGEWEECSHTCGEHGLQYRVVYCQKVYADGRKITVDDDQCIRDRPAYSQECNRFTCPDWHAGPWSSCSEQCGDAVQYRSVACQSQKEGDNNKLLKSSACDADEQPENERACNLGPCEGLHFVTTDWDLCEKCNDTTETRTVSCDDQESRTYPLEKCVTEENAIPADSRSCAVVIPCTYQWHSSQWSDCSTQCGHGHQDRSVACAIEQLGMIERMEDMHCNADERPDEKKECTNEEECTGTYFSGPWTECSESCDGGTQTRTIVCLNYDKMPVPDWCDELDEPSTSRECNIDPCPTCDESEFGCCPDNTTFASGMYNDGCSNCSVAEFGCCPDNYTEAVGPDFDGCLGIDSSEESSSEEEGSGEMATEEPEVCEYTNEKDSSETVSMPCVQENITISTDNDTLNATAANETIHCSKTEFGCCPDWFTDADGKDNMGCDPYVIGECNGTHFGCCDDQVTLARGKNLEGCGEPTCSASLYGCCKDRRTIAFGPHYAGCERAAWPCEITEFGCCPDGETAALGENGKGCGESCLVTRYGCCPDGLTTAKGAGNDGCGCAFTQYGCCADGKTSAEGPNNHGCPQTCAQTQFGCCPDGKTTARGPNKEGCPCQYTAYGCCPDGETAAQGPHSEGCDDCRYWKYRCCQDGVSKPSGPDFAGCPGTTPNPLVVGGTVSPIRIAACSLPKAQGQVAGEYMLKWHFDPADGRCTQFWYGGSGGNDNRFETEEDCNVVCNDPPGQGVCYLPKIEGPENCQRFEVRYFYDYSSEQCSAFYYRGCNGNKNNFASYEDCMHRCSGVTAPSNQIVETTPAPRPPPTRPDPNPHPHTHPPPQTHPQPPPTRAPPVVPTIPSAQPERPGTGTTALPHVGPPIPAGDQVCRESADSGPCKDYETHWYFDTFSGQCHTFIYGGCGGNYNRFESRDLCEHQCGHLGADQSVKSQQVCEELMDRGHCEGNFNFWYYEKALSECIQFKYSGCGGNGNRFHSLQQCQSVCVRRPVNFPFQQSAALRLVGPDHLCHLPKDAGSGADYQVHWYFESRDGTCRRFYFGGRGGNQNRFETENECREICAHTADPCRLPKVEGPCTHDSQDRFFFDVETAECRKFTYGGCGSNANNFDSLDQCVRKCPQAVNVIATEPESNSISEQIESPEDSTYSVCTSPQDSGSCGEHLEAWYYDVVSQQCVTFVYTGCGGNKNRFATREDCQYMCGGQQMAGGFERPEGPPPPGEGILDNSLPIARTYPRPTSLVPELCVQPADVGTCFGENLRWFFDSESNGCNTFMFTGCDGNSNRFTSEEACQRACGVFRDQDVCSLAPDVGTCDHSVNKWYYDHISEECMSFMYGGCEGNGNRFSSKAECINLCTQETKPLKDVCEQDKKVGPCRAAAPRFFYNQATGQCEEFIYGGCHGNDNNFETHQECQQRCGPNDNDIPELCSLERDTGPCTDPISQWYFDGAEGECKLFTYGGCRGNDNRFNNKHLCELRCKGAKTAPLIENPQEICTLPFDSGPCRASFEKWYFHMDRAACTKFIYGGCEGNENRFDNIQQCQATCAALMINAEPDVSVSAPRTEVQTGNRLVLNCISEASSTEKAIWFKNAHQLMLENDRRAQVFSNGTLILDPARVSDTGEFSCAFGANGLVSDNLSIQVNDPASDRLSKCEDNRDFSACDRIVKAGLCGNKRYAKYCCQTCAKANQTP